MKYKWFFRMTHTMHPPILATDSSVVLELITVMPFCCGVFHTTVVSPLFPHDWVFAQVNDLAIRLNFLTL